MLVWQDMPAMFWEDPFNDGVYYRHPQEKAQHTHELTRMIEVFPCYFLLPLVVICLEISKSHLAGLRL